MRADVIVVGGGIVGLATAWQLQLLHPRDRIVVLEKESDLGLHQSGRNSGVLHTGIYYRPGSAKAVNCTAGRLAMIEFCRENDVPFEVCGKLIVATDDTELPRLAELAQRAAANGIEYEELDADGLRAIEPHVRGVAGLRVPGAGIVDYRAVTRVLGELLRAAGAQIETGCRVRSMRPTGDGVIVHTDRGEFSSARAVNCAGLHSDRVMRASGATPPVQIVPFRGEYYELRDEARELCRHLIYPVPDPSFPFLGVHFTRTIDGHVEAGPNAVLAFAREGYTLGTISPGDVLETFGHRGFRRLAAQHWRVGMGEFWRSMNKRAFVHALQRLVPELRGRDLVPAPAGVRAQAITNEGTLADDFLIEHVQSVVHVCNAPSPAATSSLAIGARIAAEV